MNSFSLITAMQMLDFDNILTNPRLSTTITHNDHVRVLERSGAMELLRRFITNDSSTSEFDF